MSQRRRGRPREFNWIEFKELENEDTPAARILKLASVNNALIAQLATSGCPDCANKNFRFRYDEKFGIIRFYCPDCRYQTSFNVKKPRKSELTVLSTYNDQGMLVNEKVADTYHPKTKKENVDAAVQRAELVADFGGEWFDGTSGTNTQSRFMTREEALERIAKRRMRAQINSVLKELESEEKDDWLSSFKAEISRK